jgi:hypothetical protein
MICKEYLLARRLANLYMSGFNQKFAPYILSWTHFRALAGGDILNEVEMADVVKFLLNFGYLMAQSEEGVIIWHNIHVDPRNIPERVFHHALLLMSQEDEIEIENELMSI